MITLNPTTMRTAALYEQRAAMIRDKKTRTKGYKAVEAEIQKRVKKACTRFIGSVAR